MKRWNAITLLAGATLFALAWSAAAQGGKSKSAPATPSVVAADKGKFRLMVDGQQVGTEEFTVAPSGGDWISRGNLEVKMPGGATVQVSTELRLAADGRPLGYKWTSQGEKKISGSITFEGNKAEMEVRTNAEDPFTQEFQWDSAQVVILDNNFYHQYGLLARLYNWSAKGAQTFSVIVPQDLATGKVTVEWGGPQEFDGVKADLLRVKSSDLEIELYVSGGRLLRVAVPVSKADIRRE
ncbi:MAG TPA: hypothetical protein VGQ11_13705 [Candidatus Acidoferrales bacterium]|nr:hypothetical protein [Candidatus Acidoferrales bacterium]